MKKEEGWGEEGDYIEFWRTCQEMRVRGKGKGLSFVCVVGR